MNPLEINTLTPEKKPSDPKTFVVWLFIVASTMLFLAFASAYWVHRQDGMNNNAWALVQLPWQFMISCVVVAMSSITLEKAYKSASSDDVYKVPAYTTFTLILGGIFMLFQVLGFFHFMQTGHYFSNATPSEISFSFVYVIAGIHFVHILGGMVLLGVLLFRSINLKVHKKNLVFIKICKTYWHFLGILWIFLFLFLYFAN